MRRLIVSTTRSSSSASKVPSFHKRQLPVTLTAMASPVGKQLFREALTDGGLESYFPLAEQFVTQSDPSFCSVSTLTMVLNALSFDPKKVWKGAWRWVSEETLQCESAHVCGHSIEKIKADGLSFIQFESLARCHGVKITSHRVVNEDEDEDDEPHTEDDPCPESIEKFRSLVEQISQDDAGGAFIVVNFSRKVLDQTGDGHFSPIGGYHKEKDLVLIMDVARFKYPPYWVPLTQLWAAMAEPDKVSGEPRGYFVISGWNEKAAAKVQSVETIIQKQTVHSEKVHCSHSSHHHDHSHSHGHNHHVHSAACMHSHTRLSTHGHFSHTTRSTHNHSSSSSVYFTPHSQYSQHGTDYTFYRERNDHSIVDSHHSHHHHHHNHHHHVASSRPRHTAISTAHLVQQNNTRTQEEPELNMRSPALCPPMIRTWQDFKKYEPRGSCCPKHRKLADRSATAEWFASPQ